MYLEYSNLVYLEQNPRSYGNLFKLNNYSVSRTLVISNILFSPLRMRDIESWLYKESENKAV